MIKSNWTFGQQGERLLPLFSFGSKTEGKKPEAALQLQSLGLFSCFLDNVLIACLASGSAGLLAAGDRWGFFVLVCLGKEK